MCLCVLNKQIYNVARDVTYNIRKKKSYDLSKILPGYRYKHPFTPIPFGISN